MKRKFYVIAFTLLGLLNAQWASAQDVTIRSDNGNTLPAVKGTGVTDAFYSMGGFALWKHNQLNLQLTAADIDDGFEVSDIGQFENPANNIFTQTGSTALVVGRGASQDCYLALTLPKGYRFTGYTIEFRRNVNLGSGGNGNASFGEIVRSETTPTNNNPWAWYNNATHVTGLSYSSSAALQTITRTSMSETDMGNTLYFRLTNNTNTNGRAFIELTSVTLRFTAEADYPVAALPVGDFSNRTAVDIPFSTSCVDLGSIANRPYAGSTRMSYSYENVQDLMANLTLFQSDAIESGTNYDGNAGMVVKYADGGTISQEGDYFQIGTAGTTEKLYYIESPTYVKLNDAAQTKNPIAYRIVGAKINYTYGEHRDAVTRIDNVPVNIEKTVSTFTISGTVDLYEWHNGLFGIGAYWENIADPTYYLTSDGGISTNSNSAAEWFWDNGYIRLVSDPTKYLKNTNNGLAVVENVSDAALYNIDEVTGYITIQQAGNMYLCLNVNSETHNRVSHVVSVNRFQMINNGEYKVPRKLGENKTLSWTEYQDQEVVVSPEFNPSNYTLHLYDKAGVEKQSIEVTSTTPDGFLEVTDMNNDAVKIGVEGIGLINAEITMQALDPYIDQMTVVCTDNEVDIDQQTEGIQPLKITRTFNSTDFTVGGDAFYFNLPAACLGNTAVITFEDLYSHYADASYTLAKDGFNGSADSYSRFNFVKSAHFNAFDATASGVTTNSLYNNYSEAANPQLERLKVGIVGSAPFTFNNSASVGTSGGTLIEYPFTLQNYTGTFGNFTFLVKETEEEDTRYVFTTDETAYNISPATATQHRSYAFYTMEVHVQSATYQPKVEIKPVYSSTYCGADKTGSFYGAVVTAPYEDETHQGHQGFASTAEIFEAINTVIENGGKDDFNHTYADFTNSNQLLYLDFSQLAGTFVVATEGEGGPGSEEEYSATNAANCLIFLPVGTSAPNNNVAYKVSATSNVFQAAKDIVLTDKEPFYSPYKINVDANQKIEYKRLITKDKYGKVQNASILMPFAVTVDGNGIHTNEDGSTISLHSMQDDAALTVKQGQTFAYFPELSNVNTTTANTPYLVQLDESSSEDGVSFVVSQKGGTIHPTFVEGGGNEAPIMNNMDYTFTGNTASGVVAEGGAAPGTYTFTAKGTYAGIQIAKDKNVFYFAKNVFVNSATLDDNIATAKVQPFRGYFSTTGANAKFDSFSVIFSAGLGDMPTSINAVDASRFVDMNAPVYDMQGRMVARAYRDLAGKNVEPGLYVVNGVKIMVK